MKSTVVCPCQFAFTVNLICCIAFGSASRVCCLPKSMAINLQTKIFLTYRNFSNVIICSQIIFYWLIKKTLSINRNIIVFYFYSSKKNTLRILLGVHYFQMIKQKACLLPENLDQLSNLNIGLEFFLLLLIDIYSS